ncbi:MAG: hypothetical protein ACNS60_14875 [Candidatus Cyclobacteriaceae bacterium M2_1C_046]
MKQVVAFLFILINFASQSQVPEEQDGQVNSVALRMDRENRYVLHYGKLPQGVVRLKIFNSNNRIVHHEIIRHPMPFSRPYNLSMMPDDEYIFEITENDTIFYLTVFKPTDVDKNYLRFVHVRPLKNDKYMLSVANNISDRIMIRIYTGEGDMLFSGIETMDLQFSKMYNLSEYNYESYVFEVIDKFGVLNSIRIKN